MTTINEVRIQHQRLQSHPIYQTLSHLPSLRIFMKYHVFAVFDFMSLLKALQSRICPSIVPWKPSPYPKKIVRFINEIVLGEESDLDYLGRPASHFEIYLEAMSEIGANRSWIDEYLQTNNMSHLPQTVKNLVSVHTHQSLNLSTAEIAGSFLYGREQLIPIIFKEILVPLRGWKSQYPHLYYYFKRHIDVDSHNHGPMSKEIFTFLCQNDKAKTDLAFRAAITSCKMRHDLWDAAFYEIRQHIPDLKLVKKVGNVGDQTNTL